MNTGDGLGADVFAAWTLAQRVAGFGLHHAVSWVASFIHSAVVNKEASSKFSSCVWRRGLFVDVPRAGRPNFRKQQ